MFSSSPINVILPVQSFQEVTICVNWWRYKLTLWSEVRTRFFLIEVPMMFVVRAWSFWSLYAWTTGWTTNQLDTTDPCFKGAFLHPLMWMQYRILYFYHFAGDGISLILCHCCCVFVFVCLFVCFVLFCFCVFLTIKVANFALLI